MKLKYILEAINLKQFDIKTLKLNLKFIYLSIIPEPGLAPRLALSKQRLSKQGIRHK